MNDTPPVRIAMWSGPRNISTAMMRSFENRPDCVVWDEPFYAAYLAKTGLHHPMYREVIAAGMEDPADVVKAILGPVPGNKPVFYQKHMLQHMIDGVPEDWFGDVSHAFLIRDPEKMVASYAKKRAEVEAEDLGYTQLERIYAHVESLTGNGAPVIDADEFLANPDGMLRALCDALAIPFYKEMLSWPSGTRDSDGVWAEHWYEAVRRSTGFQVPEYENVNLESVHQKIADACLPHYTKFKSISLSAKK
ncbi:MAG: hypothetical protein ACR2OR_17330 [Hyphomicrobiales bacterium]